METTTNREFRPENVLGTSIAIPASVAHLNLRDHRIEAKIAYVGPEAHILSTFARLRNEPAFSLVGDRVLDWRPPAKRFRDCDIHVKLVVGERENADGVVLVEERTTAPTLEEEIATLDRALVDVIATLEKDSGAKAMPAGDPGHPLLTALRQVLRDTVREHIEELALRLDSKDNDDALAVHVLKTLDEINVRPDIKAVRDDIRTAADSIDAVMLRIQRFDAFMKRLEKIEDSIEALHLESVARSESLNTRMNELIEELKKPKKSWFT